MSEEVRSILGANPQASNKDIFAALTEKFGKGSFKESSVGVAASNQRRKLGLGKSRSVKKRRPRKMTPGAKPVGRPPAPTTVSLEALQAAKGLLSAVKGDESAAVAAVRQLRSLQLKG